MGGTQRERPKPNALDPCSASGVPCVASVQLASSLGESGPTHRITLRTCLEATEA